MLPYTDGTYRTGDVKVGAFSRAFPTLAGAWRIMAEVRRASKEAMRGAYGDEEWAKSSRTIIRSLESVGVKLELTGVDVMTSFEGPCVFVGNHMSTLETFCLPAIIEPFKHVTFVVKQSLVTAPVFGPVMRSRNPIAVSRTDPRGDLKKVLGEGVERLKAGSSMIIFPQTTRLTVFDPTHFNTLGIKLAVRAGVPVVPIAMRTDAWGVGYKLPFIKEFGKIDPSIPVHIAFGKPLHPTGHGTEEHHAVIDFIMGNLRKWGAEVVEGQKPGV